LKQQGEKRYKQAAAGAAPPLICGLRKPFPLALQGFLSACILHIYEYCISVHFQTKTKLRACRLQLQSQ
jgi:hypothetical protein